MIFRDRVEAGKKLAKLLKKYGGGEVVVYALPRGGVVVGAEVAKALNAPLDLIITRKIRHPYSPEYAIVAVAENGHSILNKDEVLGIDEEYLKEEGYKQQLEARRRREVYLSGRKPIPCRGKVAILVDDGIATGFTVKAAVSELKLHYFPKKIIVAVPVAPVDIAEELEKEGVEVKAVSLEEDFLGAIGAYYRDFSTVEDSDVVKIMKKVKGYGHIPIQAV